MTPAAADLQRGRAQDPLVRATGLHHLVLETPDIVEASRFYEDFGLVLAARFGEHVYFRAAGSAHHCLVLAPGRRARLARIAVTVETELDLRKLASLPGASPVASRITPGGGLGVMTTAPDGFVVEAVMGVAETALLPRRAPPVANRPGNVLRRGSAVRLPPAPSQITRIGHAVLETARPRALVAWWMRTFGFIASDVQALDDANATPVVTFLRCDRGETPTDHHTIAVALGPRAGLAHVAFEVDDVDEIGRGAAWLSSRGRRHAWGIGRHLLGSQVFDYWRAPDGTVVEHYADGDVFDRTAPTGRSAFRGSNLLQWGPKPPKDFGRPPLSPHTLIEAARAIAASDEVSLPLLTRALAAIAR